MLRKLDANVQKRILAKLEELKKHPSVLSVLEFLVDMEPATHRLRIGDYRALMKSEGDGIFTILKVGHRRDVYK